MKAYNETIREYLGKPTERELEEWTQLAKERYSDIVKEWREELDGSSKS
ncbi:MAG: hypothetical protein GY941_22310 [Planctomycetes bacterium]|nr:hypothetical protein [Planctomycetota bacterium]